MKGLQTIILTPESVTEALQDYLNKHLLIPNRIRVITWIPEAMKLNHVRVEVVQVTTAPIPVEDTHGHQ